MSAFPQHSDYENEAIRGPDEFALGLESDDDDETLLDSDHASSSSRSSGDKPHRASNHDRIPLGADSEDGDSSGARKLSFLDERSHGGLELGDALKAKVEKLEEGKKEAEEKVTWMSLPHKRQLAILTIARLSEPLVQTSLQVRYFPCYSLTLISQIFPPKTCN